MGFVVRWNLLPGLAGVGAVREAQAQHAAAAARVEAVQEQARLEAASAERLMAAAERRVAVAQGAHEEAQAALAQAQLRYRQGQSPITELLDVQAAATGAHLGLLAARRDLFTARAALDFAYGAFDR